MSSINNRIKKNLLETGKKEHKCENCNNINWLNKPIPLELHHIDGDSDNNNDINLQLLCPNCHSLTPNFRGRNKKRGNNAIISEIDIINVIPKCQSIKEVLQIIGLTEEGANYKRIRNIIKNNNINLKQRMPTEKEIEYRLASRKCVRPSPEELKSLVWTKPITQIAKDLGVTDNAIHKWCLFYGIEKPVMGHWTKVKYGKI